jgi:hypothetical protein
MRQHIPPSRRTLPARFSRGVETWQVSLTFNGDFTVKLGIRNHADLNGQHRHNDNRVYQIPGSWK